MINLIGILAMLIIEACIIYFAFKFQKDKYERMLDERDGLLAQRTFELKAKKIQIKELQDELSRQRKHY